MTPPPETHAPEELLAHDGWVRALARRLVHDEGEAEDLVQETWLAALKSPPRRDRPPRPWLARVLRNSMYARGLRRRDRAWHEREREVREPAERAPDDLLQRVEAQQLVTEELLALPEPFRSTVLERYWNGRTSADIARRDDLPPGTVRWRLKHGLDLLRARLDQRLGDRASWCALLLPLTGPGGVVRGGGAAGVLASLGGPALLGLGGVGALLALAAALLLQLLGADPEALAPLASDRTPTPTTGAAGADPLGPASPARTRATPPAHRNPDRQDPPRGPVPRTDRTAATSASPGAHAPADAARLRARVLGPDGDPVPDAHLTLQHAGARVHAALDGAGHGSLPLDTDHERLVQVVAGAPGCACALERLRLGPGERRDLGTLRLAPAAHLEGVVRDADGVPLADVEVVASALAPDPASPGVPPERPACPCTTRTDADGRFAIPCAPTGPLWLHLAHPTRGGRAEDLGTLDPGERRGDLELVLGEPTPWLRVTVRDAAGAPDPDARLAWRRPGGRTHGATLDGGGVCDLGSAEGLVPGEPLELCAWVPGEGRVALAAVEADGGDLCLRPAPAAPTHLHAAAGPGGPNAPTPELEARCLWGDQELFARSGPAPLALPCPAGPHRVEVRHGGRRVERVDLDRRHSRLALDLWPTDRLRGSLREADGARAAGARVALYRSDPDCGRSLHGLPLDRAPQPAAVAVVDPRGAFELEVPEAGRYLLRAEAPGQVPLELGPLELDPATAPEPLQLAFGDGGRLLGRLDARPRGPDPRGPAGGAGSLGGGHPAGPPAALRAGGRRRALRPRGPDPRHLVGARGAAPDPHPPQLDHRARRALRPGRRARACGRGGGRGARRGRGPRAGPRPRALTPARTEPGARWTRPRFPARGLETARPPSHAGPMEARPRALLLDLMDTLVRDPFYEDMPAFFGWDLGRLIAEKHPRTWLEFELGRIDEADLWRDFFADGRAFDHAGLKRTTVAGWRWLPGMRELLEELRAAGVPCHLLSNYPVWWREVVERLDMDGLLERCFVSCDLGLRKPDPACYDAVVAQLERPAADLLFVDDREANVHAARERGLAAWHFDGAEGLRAELLRLGLLT